MNGQNLKEASFSILYRLRYYLTDDAGFFFLHKQFTHGNILYDFKNVALQTAVCPPKLTKK